MDKTDPPVTFGVFKPAGHTVITYRSTAEVEQAEARLVQEEGVLATELVRYSSAEMVALADAELLSVNPLASFGYELDQLKANRVLALEGCSFLVVKPADDAQAERIADIARSTDALAAQHYGTFMIQELITQPG